MPDSTIHVIRYCLPTPVGEDLLRRKVTWSAWSSTYPYYKGYGKTKEEAVKELLDNIQRKGGDEDAE